MGFGNVLFKKVVPVFFVLSVFQFLFCISASAQVSRTWDGGGANNLASTAANWVGDVLPGADDYIVLDGTSGKHITWDAGVNGLSDSVGKWTQTAAYTGSVTILTVYPGQGSFSNFIVSGDCVISNGVWTHLANPSSVTNFNNELYRLRFDVGGDLIVGPDGKIDVTGQGYRNRKGPGYYGSAGSYGGRGNISRGSGPCYGSTVDPLNLGSGGNSSAGGGAVLITVAREIQNNGLICSDGGPVSYYSGSGGSVYLVSGTLAGSGTIRAQGGNTANNYAGGGGRVAVVVTNAGADFSGFTGTVSAYAGESSGGIWYRGNAGTVYLQKGDELPGRGELIVDNQGGIGARYYAFNTALGGETSVTCEFSRITLTNSGVLDVGPGNTLIATNTVFAGHAGATNGTCGIWLNGAALVTPPDFAYSNMFIGISAEGSTFSPANTFTIGDNVEFRVDKPHVMDCDLIIESGGKLTHTANGGYRETGAYKIDLTINGSLTVQAGGAVDLDFRGFLNGSGPAGTGGGHGGRAGDSFHPYGSIVAPVELGSTYLQRYRGGGGAVRLDVSGTLQNDGVVSAEGDWSGSGGSIWLTSGVMTGSGPISAPSSGHGGGRIALTVTNAGADFSGYTGAVTAYGRGGGTVYMRTFGQGLNEGTLIVDNNAASTYGAEISQYVSDAYVGNVVIKNSGYLVVETNFSLSLSGVWSNSAVYEGRSGSQIVFTGGAASTSYIYGATTFMGLTCTNTDGKVLLFEAGNTNTIPDYGRLLLQGSETGTNLLLRSTSGATHWNLNVSPMADQSLFYVDVMNSDALSGAQVVAINSRDSGGNLNWLFVQASPGETNVWTGNSNTVWATAPNWSLGRQPIEEDFIIIPASRPRYPVLDNHRTVSGIEIQSGASLTLGGYDFTVVNNALVSGALTADALETVTFMGNASFAGGSFESALSEINLAGGGAQAFDPDNLTFYKINLRNESGTVDFMSGFSASELRCEAPSGTRSLRFVQGATVDVRDFVMLGNVAETNIVLRSSVNGQKWNLVVSGYRSVRGVDVRDSDAGGGFSINAVSSANSGGNVNWTFDAAQSVWLGTTGADFHNASNWNTGVVPGPGDSVLMDSANPMTVTGSVTLLDLTVGGGVDSALATVNAPLTVIENIIVLTNGTLVLSRPSVAGENVYVLAGGVLTHSANPTAEEVNKLDLTVHGDMEVDLNGGIDATGKGHGLWGLGSGYGGRGHGDEPCFGSFIAPTNLGRGWTADTPAGGAVLLKVSGAMKHYGCIMANGMNGNYRTGSGGSIYITAGSLIGFGSMDANGGIFSGHSGGGGGRVSLVVTNAAADFSGYTGTVRARSSTSTGGTGAGGGAGTIYLQTALDSPGRGVLHVDNDNLTGSAKTDLPPASNYTVGESYWLVFRVSNGGKLFLAENHKVGDMWLDTANSVLDLNFNTLYINSFRHDLGPGTVINYGEIKWIKGTLIKFW